MSDGYSWCDASQKCIKSSVEKCTAPAPAATTVVISQNAQFGPILTDGNGMTLYIFNKDEIGKPSCYGKCATNWPHLTTADGNVSG